VGEKLQDDDLAEGSNNLLGTVVPAGEIWIIQNATILCSGTSPSKLAILLATATGTLCLRWVASPVADDYYTWTGTCILKEGERMQGRVLGATAGDMLFFRYAGYRMEIE